MNGRSPLAALRGLLARSRSAPTAAGPAPGEPAFWALVLEDGAELVDFDTCPREQRRQPHAISDDGTRTCFECGHTTPGRTR